MMIDLSTIYVCLVVFNATFSNISVSYIMAVTYGSILADKSIL